MANTWDDSIRPFLLRRSDDIESIWVGGKDGSKWCEVGTPSEIAVSGAKEGSWGRVPSIKIFHAPHKRYIYCTKMTFLTLRI